MKKLGVVTLSLLLCCSPVLAQQVPSASAAEQALGAELGEQINKNVQLRTAVITLTKQLEEQKAKVADLTKQLDEAKKTTVTSKGK